MSKPNTTSDGLDQLLERVSNASERLAKASEEQFRQVEQRIRELVHRAERTSDRLVTQLRDQISELRRDVERLARRGGESAKKTTAKKTPAKKTPAKKTPAKRHRPRRPRPRRPRPRRHRPRRPRPRRHRPRRPRPRRPRPRRPRPRRHRPRRHRPRRQVAHVDGGAKAGVSGVLQNLGKRARQMHSLAGARSETPLHLPAARRPPGPAVTADRPQDPLPVRHGMRGNVTRSASTGGVTNGGSVRWMRRDRERTGPRGRHRPNAQGRAVRRRRRAPR